MNTAPGTTLIVLVTFYPPSITSSFKLSLMQYLNGQKIRVGSCRTKDILFTGNHKNKSMASYSEDKAEMKPRIHRLEEDVATGGTPSMLMGQSFYSEEPDSIPEESRQHPPSHPSGRSNHAPQHMSYASYNNSPRLYNTEHIPRIHEPMVTDPEELPHRQHTMDKEPYTSNQGNRSPVVGAAFAGPNRGQAPSAADGRTGPNSGFPVKSKTWNDTLITPKITKVIPDGGDMLGGAELTIFGSGFSGKNKALVCFCCCSVKTLVLLCFIMLTLYSCSLHRSGCALL